MGWFEDSIEEFRKLPPAGKVAVGGAAVGVALLAYASYRANAGTAGSASAANSNNTGTTGTGADSALTGLGVPSLSSSPADWQNWFSNGLTIPQTASDGAPASATGSPGGPTSSGGVTYTPPAASAASAFQSAAASVTASVSAPPAPKPAPAPAPARPAQSYPIQNPTAPAQIAHRPRGPVPTFIPTTIRPIAPPTGTRSGGRAI